MNRRQQPFVGDGEMRGYVASVNAAAGHDFSKAPQAAIRLLEGLGVEGDAHCGRTVRHRSRVRRDPTMHNLRQVHLLHTELFEEMKRVGHPLLPGDMGENVTTTGVDLLGLPADTVLRLGDSAAVVLTGLRNPCSQIDTFQRGLLGHMVGADEDGRIVRRSGVMAVVRRAGLVRAGDPITVVLPPAPHRTLDVV